MKQFSLKRLGLFLAVGLLGLASCDPKLQGGGYATPNVMVGFGNWDGNGVGFGAYGRTGGIIAGTGVCLYQDANGDGKLTCGEVAGCAKKTGGGSEKYVTGGSTAGSGAVPPPGFICGEVAYKDDDGDDHKACITAKTQPGTALDVCGLKECCPCIDCPEEASTSGTDKTGNHSLHQAAAQSIAQTSNLRYDLRDDFGNPLMSVEHDVSGSSWTILASQGLGASTIEMLQVTADGAIVNQTVLPVSYTAAGLQATYSGTVKTDHFTVFSARQGTTPLANFFVNVTDRGKSKTEAYFDQVYNAVFQ